MVLLRVETQQISATNIISGDKCYIAFLGNTNWQSVGAPSGATVGTVFTSTSSNVTGTGAVVLLRPNENELPVYHLDLGEVSLKANYSILEIQDITKRKSENTQAFTLPFSDKNNDFFSHFYDVNSSGRFDVNVKTNAIVTVDSIEVINGYLQLLSVNTESQTYEVVVYGVIANIVNQLSDKKLTELDFSEFNHTLTKENVMDSWDGAITYSSGQTGDEILYPLIDYGYGYDVADFRPRSYLATKVTAENLKPAIKVKEVFDKILRNVGFTSIAFPAGQDDFFFNQYMTLETINETSNVELEDEFLIGKTTDQTLIGGLNTLIFDDQTASAGKPFFDEGGNLDSNGWYTPISDGYYQFEVTLDLDFSGTSTDYRSLKIKTYAGPTSGPTVRAVDFINANGDGRQTYISPKLYIEAGDTVAFTLEIVTLIGSETCTVKASSTVQNTQTRLKLIDAPVSSTGTTIDLSAGNNILPSITQIDFLKSFISRYNLVLQPLPYNPNHLEIDPIQDFFDVGVSKDWTNKLDLSKSVSIKPTYEFQKDKVIFKDLEAEDVLTKRYEEANGHPYNYYSIDIKSDFKQKGANLEIASVFSSFTNDVVPEIGLLIPRFYKEDNGEIQRLTTKPKLFYYSGLKDCGHWQFWEAQESGSTTHMYQFPFCSSMSMAGDKITDTDFDIRFKYDYAIGEQDGGFITRPPMSDTFTKFWSEYLHNIFDKDARILTAHFKLTSSDIAEFKYNDKIFIKDAYYRVNKISNYAIGKDLPTQVELVKILNFKNTLAIAGCNLQANPPNLYGFITFSDPNTGALADPNQVCCESNGGVWYGYTSLCVRKKRSKINTKQPPVKISRFNDDTTLGRSGKTVRVTGEVKEFGDSDNATDGQIASWNATDQKVEWIDESGGAPGGQGTQGFKDVQYNDNGSFGGDANLQYSPTFQILSCPNIFASNLSGTLAIGTDLATSPASGDDSLKVASTEWVLDNATGISSGASGDVQFNDGSNGFAGESDFNYNTTTNSLSVPSINASGLITSKQRHVIHCGFSHATTSNVYLPFGYGGIFDSTSSSGYLEYGGFIAPCDGHVEFITIRGENAGGNTSVAVNVAGPHVEVPVLGPGSFSGGNVNMSSDDVAYKWDTFVNQGGASNSFNAGDVIMISMNASAVLHDAVATAVLVLDWNNPL